MTPSQQADDLAKSRRDTAAMVVIMHQAHLSEQRALGIAVQQAAELTSLKEEDRAVKQRLSTAEVRNATYIYDSTQRSPVLLKYARPSVLST